MSSKEISLSEVKKHKNKGSLWMVIHNEVYDVTKFLEEHPGGEDTLTENAGIDATQAFEDVGHSEDARQLLKKYKIGTLPAKERQKTGIPRNCKSKGSKTSVSTCPSCLLRSPKKARTEKTWRTFDGSSPSSCSRSRPCKEKSEPKVMGRVSSIVVPRERKRRPQSPPQPSGGYLKWAILALAGAIIIGVALKKYAS